MINFLLLLRIRLLQFETFLLVFTFLMVLFIAVTQILLRNIFDMGIIWADTFLRISVLWLGLMGALLASRNNNHISMDLGQKYLSEKYLIFIKIIIYLFTAGICFIVTWYGVNLVFMEYEESGLAFANIPIWLTMSIIPVVFLIMGLRYLTLFILLLSGRSAFDKPVIKQS